MTCKIPKRGGRERHLQEHCAPGADKNVETGADSAIEFQIGDLAVEWSMTSVKLEIVLY